MAIREKTKTVHCDLSKLSKNVLRETLEDISRILQEDQTLTNNQKSKLIHELVRVEDYYMKRVKLLKDARTMTIEKALGNLQNILKIVRSGLRSRSTRNHVLYRHSRYIRSARNQNKQRGETLGQVGRFTQRGNQRDSHQVERPFKHWREPRKNGRADKGIEKRSQMTDNQSEQQEIEKAIPGKNVPGTDLPWSEFEGEYRRSSSRTPH